MTCPRCNLPMNHHAEKVVTPRNAAEAAAVDPALGGALIEHHACPACGLLTERLFTPSRPL